MAARILLFHANNLDVGGADYCLARTAIALKDSGRYEPVVVLRLDTRIRRAYEDHGVPVHIVDVPRLQKGMGSSGALRLPAAFASAVARLRDLIVRERIDLVHSNDLLDLHGPAAARMAGRPSVQHVRMIPSPAPLRLLLGAVAGGLNARTLCVSEAVRQQTMHAHPGSVVLHDWLDPEALQAAPPGDPRAELGIPASAPLIVCAGRLEPWKGQDLLVTAAETILRSRPDAHFVLLGGRVPGREAFAEKLRDDAERRGLAGHVHLLGERPDVLSWMRASSFVAHTSRAPDPLPGVVLEAGYVGKAVVGARAGGVPEEVPPDNHGLLFEPGDAADLARKMMLALADRRLAERGAKARAFVQEKFQKQRLFAQLDGIYQRALGGT